MKHFSFYCENVWISCNGICLKGSFSGLKNQKVEELFVCQRKILKLQEKVKKNTLKIEVETR